jgi:hypothetical protein
MRRRAMSDRVGSDQPASRKQRAYRHFSGVLQVACTSSVPALYRHTQQPRRQLRLDRGRGRAVIRTGSHGANTLVLADAIAIKQQVPLIKSVSPNVDGSVQVIYGNQNWFTRYRGVSPEYFDIKRAGGNRRRRLGQEHACQNSKPEDGIPIFPGLSPAAADNRAREYRD